MRDTPDHWGRPAAEAARVTQIALKRARSSGESVGLPSLLWFAGSVTATDASPVTIATLDTEAYDTIVRDIERYWVPGRVPMLHHLFLHHFANLCLVARDGDQIAGFLFGLLSTTTPGDAYVHLVATRDDYRRRGLARLLHSQFRAHATPLGATTVSAVVRPGNAASIALHERLGMTGELHRSYAGPGEDRLVFRGPIT